MESIDTLIIVKTRKTLQFCRFLNFQTIFTKMAKKRPTSNSKSLRFFSVSSLFFLFSYTILTSFLLLITFSSREVMSQDRTGFFYCSDTICEEELRQRPCPERRNCSTIGFRTFLDPSQCNCCQYCFDYLQENDTCSLNSPQKPIEMCGPHLTCEPALRPTDPATCQTITVGPNDKPGTDPEFCMTKRKQYLDADANGTLGMVQFLPECDAGGKYAPRQCIPGSLCYCSNSEGIRVFGQALPQDKQDCACARDVAKLQEFGFGGRMPHCLPNGDYDELQCVIRTCYCRSYPDVTYHPQNMTRLPCYNESLHIYDPDTPLFYMRPCELEKALAEIEVAEAALNNTLMIISDVPNCDPDGNFARIQTDFDTQFCADAMTGEVLEGFVVNKISSEAKAMNCYCARARHLLRESATGKPQCCKNGNYRKLQHIGSTWFCVDEYGRQNVTLEPIEVHEQLIDTLPCYEEGLPISAMGCSFE